MIRFSEELTFAEEMQHAAENMAVGLLVVFAILLFLMLVIYLFRFLPDPSKRKKEAEKKAAEGTPASVSAASEINRGTIDTTGDSESEEIAAVIAAAIAAASVDYPESTYVVKRIRRNLSGSRHSRTRA